MNSTGTITETNLRILIADEDEAALRGLHGILEQLGHEVTPYAVSVNEAVDLIVREAPQVAIVVVHEDDEHALALIGEAVEYADGPVIAQLPGADLEFLSRAAERGISAFAESSDPESIQGTIEVAVRRYREGKQLHDKVEQLEDALVRRGVIERAKGHPHGAPQRDRAGRLRADARPLADERPPRDRRGALRARRSRAASQASVTGRPGHVLEPGDFKRAFARFQEDGMTQWAAAVTYFSLLSLFPALLVGVALLGVFGQQGLVDEAADYLKDAGAPRETVDAVTAALESAQSQRSTATGALVFGLVTALYAASASVRIGGGGAQPGPGASKSAGATWRASCTTSAGRC